MAHYIPSIRTAVKDENTRPAETEQTHYNHVLRVELHFHACCLTQCEISTRQAPVVCLFLCVCVFVFSPRWLGAWVRYVGGEQ
jgi:hypothetical protein